MRHSNREPFTPTRTRTPSPFIFFCSYRPPPATNVSSTLVAESLRRQRERLGDLEVYPEPRKTDEALWEFDMGQALQRTQTMIDQLGETNPVLRTMLENAKQEIKESNIDGSNSENTYYGRRLLQRMEYNTRVTDELITHELMAFYGKGGIPGVTVGSVRLLNSNSSPKVCTFGGSDFHRLRVRSARHFARAQSRTRTPRAPTSATRLLSSAPRPSRTRIARAGATCCRCARRRRHRGPLFSVLSAPFARPQNMGACKVEDFGVGARSASLERAHAYAY